MATREKGTMLIHPLDFEQFDQGVNKKLAWPCLEWLEGSYETSEGMQYELQTTPKWNEIKPKTNLKKQEG